MPAEITMPQLSDTMTDGTLVRWAKAEGQSVRSGEEIAEVETDKATMPMEAFESGVLAYIAVPAGQKVAVGGLLGVLATGSENPAEVRKQYAAAPARQAAPSSHAPAGQAAAPAGQSASSESTKPRRLPASVRSAASPGSGVAVAATIEQASVGEMHEPDGVGHGATREPAQPVPPLPQSGNGDRLRASPLARRIAQDERIDLTKLTGSGPNGRIIQRDVMAAIARPPNQSASGARASDKTAPSGQSVELSPMRITIAKRLQQSKQTIPHFYETIDIDVEQVSQLRGHLNEQLEPENVRLSIGDFVAKAVAAALLRHPGMNAHFSGSQITRFETVNLGMAVALPDGLIVPVLRGVERLGLKEIRTRSADLVARARGQRLRQDELSGATFTVSNLGAFGVREFSAIINPPEVGILAIGAAEKRAVVRGEQIVPRTMLTVTVSADHRAVDGAGAAEFLRTLKAFLEEPALMLV